MGSVIERAKEFLKRLFQPDDGGYSYRRLSRFAHFLDGIEEGDPEYTAGHSAVVLCDESLNLVGRRVALINSLQKAEEHLAELECYNNLSDEEAAHLKSLFERHRALTRDKSALVGQVVSFSGAISKVADLEGKEERILSDLQDAEKNARAFKQDVAVLSGEKGALETELEQMKSTMDLTHKLAQILTWVFAGLAVIMAFAFIFAGARVLLPAALCIIAAIIVSTLIYMLRRRLRVEIRRNVEKQKRAVGLLNTKSVVYAHYRGFLKHQYGKYAVRGSENLRHNIKEYASYKHLTKRLDSVRNILYQTEEELEEFIRKFKIPNVWATMEQFIQSVDVDNKRGAHLDAATRKAAIEKSLEEIEGRQARIWLELDQLGAVSVLASRIIKAYESSAERMMEKKDTAEIYKEEAESEAHIAHDKES